MSSQMCRWWRSWWLCLVVPGLLIASQAVSAPFPKKEHDPPVPLEWLTADEQARFEAGRRLFEFPFTPKEGLGPRFNGRTCEACHHIPVVGGSGPGYRGNIRYILPSSGSTQGVLFHDMSIARGPAEGLPDNAIISKRRPSTLMGLGLIEAIPEEALLANADPDDKDRDGIRGRPAMKEGHVMRFGSQSHVATLFEFVADALRQEMGMTSAVAGFNAETAQGELPMFMQNRVPEPNVSIEVVNELLDFVSLLAPPERSRLRSGESQVLRGEKIFTDIACAKCHVPIFHTSKAPIARGSQASPMPMALLNQDVRPYSDFLLHDMGSTLNDGVSLGAAKPGEYRTPPLWGLRFRLPQLLHDSRASSAEQAIIFHGGEAARSRNAFLALPLDDRHALVEFLKTL